MLTRDRDYSMMVTKQPEWCNNKPIGNNFRKNKQRKCKVIDTETGEESLYSTLREADIDNGWNCNRTLMGIRNKALIDKRYRAEYCEA